ncbi:MAG: UDP-N-acetylmuramoyl-L-alanine--D-glutamate ligase [Acidobacteriota bacterium]
MRILVAGMGTSGYWAAHLALRQGHQVSACDQRTTADLALDLSKLLEMGLVFYGGSESPGLLEGMECLILSPGVPRRSALVRSALERGIPVIGEIEWGFRHAKGRIAAVTGSNGKSTTTTLLGKLLGAHFSDVRTGGNLGRAFCEMVDGSTEKTWFVLEVSSFQLESLERFKADVAILLNITPDHQDRYARFEDYQAAKGRIFQNQGPSDFAVYSTTDPAVAAFGAATSSIHVPFATVGELPEGAFVREGQALWRRSGGQELLFRLKDLPLPGVHNLENALAACLAARCAGVPEGALAEPLSRFRGLPHRLERVGEVHGAAVFNDSKATNTDAVLKALTAFRSGVILLLGGKDKGADWASLVPEARRCCRAVIAFGAARDKVVQAFRGALPVESYATLREATTAALAMASPGDSVVLSPACASFDEFRNFEDRGEQFTAWVREAMTP